MEIAGVSIGVVGLVGLVSACVDALDKVDAYRSFGFDSHALSLCFEADRHRFSRWLEAVGIVNGHVKDEHHPLLDDPTLKPLLYKILSCVCSIWGVGGATLAAFDVTDLDSADAHPGGGGGDGKLMKALNSAKPRHASKRAKIGWALGGKTKLVTQLEAFEALVDRLYSLVPPTGLRHGPTAGGFAGHDIRTNQLEGKLILLVMCMGCV
jgi:hypothetical protein